MQEPGPKRLKALPEPGCDEMQRRRAAGSPTRKVSIRNYAIDCFSPINRDDFPAGFLNGGCKKVAARKCDVGCDLRGTQPLYDRRSLVQEHGDLQSRSRDVHGLEWGRNRRFRGTDAAPRLSPIDRCGSDLARAFSSDAQSG